jgi:hypothetical protein
LQCRFGLSAPVELIGDFKGRFHNCHKTIKPYLCLLSPPLKTMALFIADSRGVIIALPPRGYGKEDVAQRFTAQDKDAIGAA